MVSLSGGGTSFSQPRRAGAAPNRRSRDTIATPQARREHTPGNKGSMRILLIVCLAACAAACSGNSTGPSGVSSGTAATNIAGTWDGTIVSSNNPEAQVKMVLTQSGSDVSGTWESSSVSWAGEISGTVSGSTFNGQFKFSGVAIGGTVCTGAATVTGPATTTTLSWTSAGGVVGGTCPAPLPLGLKIDAQRQ